MLRATSSSRPNLRQVLLAVAVVVLGSAVLGGLTSVGQTVLPTWVNSLSNSAGGWTAFAFLLVWASRARPVLGAILGVVSFELLNEAYGVVSGARGYFYAAPFSTIWTVVGLLAGPVIGLAAALTRYGVPFWRVAGVAVPSAVWLGEGVWALRFVADTTSPVYWTIEVVGSAVAMTVVVLRARPPLRLAAAGTVIWLLGSAAFYTVIVVVLS